MAFVSYAQNFEDVVLARALRGIERGFYMDVGAQDPTEGSVTRAFYESGWRGINIEPVDSWYRKLLEERPDDLNLNIAVGAEPGEICFFEIPGTGLSTGDPGIAERHRIQGHTVVERRVTVTTLDAVCRDHRVGEVHFLKIDVEGFEADVLRGFAFRDVRPWIVVVEAMRPLSQEPTHAAWEEALEGRGYAFAYADGLNRFYVACEHAELRDAFAYPPNVFDTFVMAAQVRAEERATSLLTSLDRMQRDLSAAQGQAADAVARAERAATAAAETSSRLSSVAADLKARTTEVHSLRGRLAAEQRTADELRARLHALLRSHSWRITAPVRLVSRVVRREITPTYAVKLAATRLITMAARFRVARTVGGAILRPFPGLRGRVRSVVLGFVPLPTPASASCPGGGGAIDDARPALTQASEEYLGLLRDARDRKRAART